MCAAICVYFREIRFQIDSISNSNSCVIAINEPPNLNEEFKTILVSVVIKVPDEYIILKVEVFKSCRLHLIRWYKEKEIGLMDGVQLSKRQRRCDDDSYGNLESN